MSNTPDTSGGDGCRCTLRMVGRSYPVPRLLRLGDDRFCSGLVRETAEVLTSYGFAPIADDSPDWYALMFVLHRFIYGGGTR